MDRDQVLHDGMVKMIVIPLLGLLVPNLTGLITNGLYSFPRLCLNYSYFILLMLLIWQGNIRLLLSYRKKYDWASSRYYQMIISLFLTNIVFSGILSMAMLYGWHLLAREPSGHFGNMVSASLIYIIIACFTSNIYEITLLHRERAYNLSRVEQLNIAKAQAELEALKNQIDPHFIFNSLNTLSFLITRDPQNARLYNDTLARVYRYILGNKEKDLVLLGEEIEFISNYFYLLKIRFGDSVSMIIEITDLSSENFLIPPISMQALVENAIKHNEFSDRTPLHIYISISSNYAIVKNIINPKSFLQPTSKIGLSNLDNRYRLITKRNIIIENNFRSFTVKLPLIKF